MKANSDPSMGRTKCDHSSSIDRSFAVAYTTDQLLYDWKSVAEPVEYDKTLKLSQFEKHETFIRSLNFSRNETSMSGKEQFWPRFQVDLFCFGRQCKFPFVPCLAPMIPGVGGKSI